MKKYTITKALIVLSFCAVFTCVLSARWIFVDKYSVDFPFHDQWCAEGLEVYLPLHEDSFEIGNWFKATNQHRIAVHRFWNTALFALNGQWDNKLQATVNALIPSLSALLVFSWMLNVGGLRMVLPGIIAVCLLFSLPYTWENMLWGIQSIVHFLVLLSLVAMTLLSGSSFASIRWCTGIFFLIVVLFTMGSGWVVSFSIGFVVIFKICLRKKSIRRLMPTVLSCFAIVAIGLLLREGTPAYVGMSTRYFILSLLYYLSWPLPGHLTAFVLWLPWFTLVALVLLRRIPMNRYVQFTLMLGLWSGIQAFGLVLLNMLRLNAWHVLARASKYTELLMFHTVASMLALLIVMRWLRYNKNAQNKLHLIAAAWMGLVLSCLLVTSFDSWKFAGRSLLAEFVEMDSEIEMVLKDSEEKIDTESFDGLLESLRNQYLKSLLPLSVRPSLIFEASEVLGFSSAGYDPRFDKPPWRGEEVYGSYRAIDADADAKFISNLLHPGSLPLLVFPMTGVMAGKNDRMSLYLREESTGIRTPVLLNDVVWRGWSFAWAERPESPYRIIAEDTNPLTWIAFQAPREAGELTRYGFMLRKSASWLFALSCALIAMLITTISFSHFRKGSDSFSFAGDKHD